MPATATKAEVRVIPASHGHVSPWDPAEGRWLALAADDPWSDPGYFLPGDPVPFARTEDAVSWCAERGIEVAP